MARLADEVINQIKSEVSLERLAESQGYPLSKRGKDWVLQCPFHEDKSPSCVISPNTNLFHCFGCGAGGSVIDWVMKTQGVSFRFACELLQKDLGLIEQNATHRVKQNTTTKLSSSLAADSDHQKVLSQVIEHYHQTLLSAEEAQAYLRKRGLDDARVIGQFKLGFANRTLCYQLPVRQVQAGAKLRSQLQAIGFLRESGHEHFNGSLVIPVMNQAGEITEVYGRKISGSKLRKGTAQHLYLPGEHQGVFNLSGLRNTEEVILCESLIDALTFWRWGFTYVTTSYGVHGFTDGLLKAFKSNLIKRVLIAYDRDTSGNDAADTLAKRLQSEGFECFRVLFPKGMDANSYACQMNPAQKALALVLRQAQWLGTGTAPKVSVKLEKLETGSDPEKSRTGTTKSRTGTDPELLTQHNDPVTSAAKSRTGTDPEPLTQHNDSATSATKSRTGTDPELLTQHNDSATSERECSQAQVGPPNPFSLAAKKREAEATLSSKLEATLEGTAVPEPLSKPIDQSASPVPPILQPKLGYELKGHEAWFDLGSRQYRVKGWQHKKNAALAHLKVNLMVCNEQGFHTDTLDLYSSKQRQVFINQAKEGLALPEQSLKSDLGQLLLTLEEVLAGSEEAAAPPEALPMTLSESERTEALALLQSPNLLDAILNDFEQIGVVGEATNKLTGYLACTSRQLARPLAVIIQSSSAAGKSSLMDAVLAMMPEEERVQYSAMTGQSLFYMGGTQLKHKILAISEEEGAHNASYALKLLQSEGEVTIASTGKDESSGELVTREYRVEGPVMLFLTTTAIDIDEELLNRCLVLSVNESRAQTQAIHKAQRQRRTLAGLRQQQQKQHRLRLHHNAQRLLRPLAVINPYADQLTFLDDKTRTRRDHEKYLTLIDSIALLHQYQRDVKHLPAVNGNEAALEYIEVSLSDIAKANELAHEVLGKTLDELPPQTRKLLNLIESEIKQACQQEQMVCKDYRFRRRQVRHWCGWSETQVRVHMQRLVAMEYLLVHRGGRGQSFEYELLYQGEGEQGDHFLMGLLDVEALMAKQNTHRKESSRGLPARFAGSSRPQNGVMAACQNEVKVMPDKGFSPHGSVNTEKGTKEEKTEASYLDHRHSDSDNERSEVPLSRNEEIEEKTA